jgi:hypothetical protein
MNLIWVISVDPRSGATYEAVVSAVLSGFVVAML